MATCSAESRRFVCKGVLVLARGLPTLTESSCTLNRLARALAMFCCSTFSCRVLFGGEIMVLASETVSALSSSQSTLPVKF